MPLSRQHALSYAQMAEALEATGEYRVLRRFAPVAAYREDTPDLLEGVYLDFETTGMNPQEDRVIEIGLVRFSYTPDGRVCRVLDTFAALEDPGAPIPEEIRALTGITDEMVRGRLIDDGRVARFVEGASLVIAHNAAFDRPFAERRFELFRRLPWACAMTEVPWRAEGIGSNKLEYIAYRYGFYFDGHRADHDCLAGVHILAQELPISGRPALAALLESSRTVSYRVWATNSPFHLKDHLKARGYWWEPEQRCWYKVVPERRLDAELEFLQDGILPPGTRPDVEVLTALHRYSAAEPARRQPERA